mmetsp:Transcript_18575/g.53039  ORF Transcript_18575/g.53039 Transcript_18575/m.53039 type:complete len:338 (-) Transcript_18575:1-1014(-)
MVLGLLQQVRDIHRKHLVHFLHQFLVELGELAQVLDLHQRLPEWTDGREISRRQPVPPRGCLKFRFQPPYQTFLLLALAPRVRQLLAQVMDDVGMHLHAASAFHQLVYPSHHGLLRQPHDVLQQVHLLLLQQFGLLAAMQRRIPKGTHVHPTHLGRVHDLPQRPHQRTVHSHQLLRRDAVGLVQHDTHLIQMRDEQFHDTLQFIRYIQLVRIEHDDHQIGTFSEPLHDAVVIVIAGTLFLSGQYARRVDHRDVLQYRRVQFDTFQSGEEVVPEWTQSCEGTVGLGDQSCAWHDLVAAAPQYRRESVRCWFRPDTDSWKVPSDEVSNERCLSDTILTQ